jgi:hypothetical protein
MGAITPPWRSTLMTWMPSRGCCPRFLRRWRPRRSHEVIMPMTVYVEAQAADKSLRDAGTS